MVGAEIESSIALQASDREGEMVQEGEVLSIENKGLYCKREEYLKWLIFGTW